MKHTLAGHRPPILENLWRRLAPAEQYDACQSLWETLIPQIRQTALEVEQALAAAKHFRPKFVQGQPLEWKARQVLAHLPKPPMSECLPLIVRAYLVVRKSPMIEAILEAEGTPHQGPWISDKAPPPTPESFIRGLTRVRQTFEDRDLQLYYAYSADQGEGTHWEGLKTAMHSAEFQELFLTEATGPGMAPKESIAAPAGKSQPVESDKTEVSEEFTTLDNLLIKNVVGSACGVEGSLGEDQLEDLVTEVLNLNSDRHHSYFHLGFLDALLGRGMRKNLPGSNVSRRGWLLSGYLMGMLRSPDPSRLVAWLRQNRTAWQELLEAKAGGARQLLLPALLPHLLKHAQWDLAAQLLSATNIPQDPSQALAVWQATQDAGANLLREGKPAEAAALLEVLCAWLRGAERRLGPMRPYMMASSLRKLGQSQLRQGRLPEAIHLLESALTHPDGEVAARIHVDLGLAKAGYRALDFLVPLEDVNGSETIVQALEGQVTHFQAALGHSPESTNAHFVLGLIGFHRRRPREAEDHLGRALSGMLKQEAAYQATNLVDWVRFLLSIVVAESCEPARLSEARSHLEKAMVSPAYFPLRFWARLLHALALYDDKTVTEKVLDHLLNKRGDPAYTLVQESGLLAANKPLRDGYRKWLDTQTLSPARKMAELEQLLMGALHGGSRQESEDLLDELECLARADSQLAPGFLKFLEDHRSRILAIWEEEDFDRANAGLRERNGQLAECREVLQRLFYRARSEGDWENAHNWGEHIRRLHLKDTDMELLTRQIEHLRPVPQSETPLSLDGVRVLYVGGDETQQAYEQSLRAEFAKDHPGLVVTFYFPGWSSNWILHYERIERLLRNHDVLVINNLVRTQLGRKLRQVCRLWRACTGRGKDSLRDSILRAAQSAVEWKSSNPE